MSETEPHSGPWQSFLQWLGLVRPGEGRPRQGAPRRSRYGLQVSPRLDQDLDELHARVAALEEGGRSPR